MREFIRWITEERWAAFVTVVLAGIDLAAGFGLDLTGQQVTLLTAFLTALGGFVIQLKVWSRNTVMHEREVARMGGYQQGVHDTRELDRTSEEGGANLDALGGLAAIGMVILFAWLIVEQVVGILIGIVKAVAG